MKKIKDPALFEKIRKFLTEDMPVLRKKSPNTVEAYRYTLNIYLVFLCEKHSKSLYNITVKDFSQKNILFFLDWLIEERGNKASTANLRLRHIKRFCRFLMDENILMISELSAIQKIAEIPNASEDTIKFLTILTLFRWKKKTAICLNYILRRPWMTAPISLLRAAIIQWTQHQGTPLKQPFFRWRPNEGIYRLKATMWRLYIQ